MRRAAKAALRSSIYDRPMQQHHDLSTLRSGERVISERVANVRSVSIGFWIGTGSRDETDARAGVSHFIEHLLFKGTSTHSAQEIAEVFDGHPIGRPVIGRAEVISTVSRRAVASYHRAAYASDNIVVAAAGNIAHDELLALLEPRLPGAESRSRPPRRPFTRVPAPGYRFEERATEQYHVCLGAPGISRRDERRFAASLLDSILGGSASSRLFQEIREKRGMAYSVYSFASQYSDSGQVGLYVGTREENLVECFEIVARELADVSAGNVRPGELERAKENLKGRMLLSMESTSNRMSRLGKSVITDTDLLTLDELVARVDAVTAEDGAGIAAELLRLDRPSAAGIGPSERRVPAPLQAGHPQLVERAAA